VFGGSNDKYYLVGTSSNPATFVLKRNDPGSSPTQQIEVLADKAAFKLFGIWSLVVH
jgi:hypothetical protein